MRPMGSMKNAQTGPTRILIFELNWMGDILFSFPLLRAIREKYPDAYITCVVVPRYSDMLVNNPWINDVHALTDNNKMSSLIEKLKFIRMIRRERYDTCFILKPSATKALMACLAGIRTRIGFAGKKNAPLTKEVIMPDGGMHRADQILSLSGTVGIKEADGMYEYSFTHEDELNADVLIRKAGGGVRRMVAVNPGGNWDAKRWPKDKYVILIKRLLEQFDNIEVVLSGAEKDIGLTTDILSKVGADRCYTMAGQTGLNELAALFKRCELVIGADSGPIHLASAIGVTTIALFGPTAEKITGPRGKGENIVIHKKIDCEIPCYVDECDRDYECMEAITVEEVLSAAEKILLKVTEIK